VSGQHGASLAFVFGYGLTMRGVLKSGLGAAAFKVALAADTVSIAVMELIDNTVVVAIPGAMDAGPASRPACSSGWRRPSHWRSRSSSRCRSTSG
jgi:hypothetical protein